MIPLNRGVWNAIDGGGHGMHTAVMSTTSQCASHLHSRLTKGSGLPLVHAQKGAMPSQCPLKNHGTHLLYQSLVLRDMT